MARVEYTSKAEYKPFWTIEIGTYFDYNGKLYLLTSEDNVYDFKNDKLLYWYNYFDSDALVLPISSDRITIKVD